jgi:spore maturation protein CgeB
MKIVIIQEAGRHEANKEFREALNLKRALDRIPGVETIVWGLNYPNYTTPFNEIEKWCDVIFLIENYTSGWIPDVIAYSNKLKIYWSIDSHCVLDQHVQMSKLFKINIHLNSTESYIPHFSFCDKSYWFPNAYPDDLIYHMPEVAKSHDIGFCGNYLNRADHVNFLSKYNIQKDIFVIGEAMVRSINSYKIHFNRNISNDINYRTFETTGCKTLLMTNHTPGLETLFKAGEEIIVYDSIQDLDEKVQYYLDNEAERNKIETAGWERAKKDHTYYERAKTLVNIINEY